MAARQTVGSCERHGYGQRDGQRRCAADTLAQKAIAAGIPGVQVDGNDVIAVRAAVEQALVRAREGEGPSLIEAITYRLSDHTTADDASRYRDDAEVSKHWSSEPLVRLRKYLTDAFGWDKDQEEKLLLECNEAAERAAVAYLSREAQPPAAMFGYTYAQMSSDLADQQASVDVTAGHV